MDAIKIDLVSKTKRTIFVWLNVYKSGLVAVYYSRDEAKQAAVGNIHTVRVALPLEITYEVD